jgi:hypothetical protein
LTTAPLHTLLHPERRVAGPHGVVLVSDGRAEEGHDAVTHDLIDRPLVVMHGLHHVLEDRIEDLPRLLGVAVGEKLHRALQIGEQHRDLLSFALERRPGGEDGLRQMPRGVRLGRAEAGGVLTRTADRVGACVTELGRRRENGAAAHARRAQRSRALQAEARLGRIVSLAAGARHDDCEPLPVGEHGRAMSLR